MPRINLEYADRFLSLLGKYSSRSFTFQTFDDRRDKRSFLAKMLHGSFNQHSRSLCSLNADGAGIFVTVNQTDMRGRSLNNIRRVRAYFVDKDDGSFDRDKLLAPPHLIVRSRNGEHAYWLVDEGDQPDRTEYLQEFPYIQKALAQHLEGDMVAHDLPRVMRIPGFLHHKQDPYLVQLITAREDLAPYRAHELIEIMELDVEGQKPKPITTGPIDQSAFPAHDERVSRCQAYMSKVGGAIEGQNGDRHTYNVCKIGGDFGLTKEEFWPILWNWNVSECQPPWTEVELENKLRRSESRRTEPFGYRLVEREQEKKSGGFTKRIRINGPGPDEPFEWPESDGWLSKLPPAAKQEEPPPWTDEPPIDAYEDEIAATAENEGYKQESKGGDGGDQGGRRKTTIEISGKKWSKPGNPDGPWAPLRSRPPAEKRSIPEMVRRMKAHFDIMRAPNGQSYVYTGKYWHPVHDDTLRAMCLVVDYEPHTSVSRRTKVRQTLADECTMRNDVPWNNLKPEEIPFDNGVLNILSGTMRHHKPDDYLDKYVPLNYDPDATCPRWLTCLDDWFGDQEDKKLALQEFFGYILMTSTAKYKMCLILLGESNTGKSQVTSIARELIGLQNICQIPLEQMDDDRKRAPIKGKMLNVISELPQWGKVAESGFKMMISNEEPIVIDAKYVAQETIIPTAKHVIATNSFPHINDRSKGVINRMLLIKFENVIPQEKMDVYLLERLKKERQGIANWAIDGARRLIESGGQWTKPKGMTHMLEKYASISNPIQLFIEDEGRVIVDEHARIRTSRFAQLYNESGMNTRMSAKNIARLMDDLGYKRIKVKGLTYYDGLRERQTADGLAEDF